MWPSELSVLHSFSEHKWSTLKTCKISYIFVFFSLNYRGTPALFSWVDKFVHAPLWNVDKCFSECGRSSAQSLIYGHQFSKNKWDKVKLHRPFSVLKFTSRKDMALAYVEKLRCGWLLSDPQQKNHLDKNKKKERKNKCDSSGTKQKSITKYQPHFVCINLDNFHVYQGLKLSLCH